MTDTLKKTSATRLRRNPKRGSYDRDEVYGILDKGFMAHIGYVFEGRPFVTPTFYWRDGDYVYWHGSSKSRMLMAGACGGEVCLNVSFFDGFVMARSGFHHSANYRSVSIYGVPENIVARADKVHALDDMMNVLFPGRLDELRPYYEKELKATKVLRLLIDEAVAKCRSGAPVDDDEDYDSVSCWAGILPSHQAFGDPIDDGRLKDGVGIPSYFKKWLG